ncbi:EI24 domain-containing protein [Streptomyces sp. 8L]|uniref:EI24 domain-containing protein n=1 Tax=Streptomyces sp. 8L TaxID=2877242 RepID=UPI001CD7E48B|nr:EI24 domain-containing protein [Streptomyces sp. 8L]MCA1223373.1 EI24 domain-containing protein [Streptomyces sp. 8L]
MGDLGAGFGFLVKGQRWVGGHGRWFGFGLLPGVVTLLVYAGALIALVHGAGDAVSWATPFADHWASPWQGLLRDGLTVLLFALGLFLAVVTFTAVTLLIGQPFYEALSEAVERAESGDGTVPESGLPWWREVLVSVRNSLYVLVRVVAWGVVLFVLGFVPVLGQSVVPAIGFCVSGFFLTQELTAVAMERRGVGAREQLAWLKRRRLMALGFGVPLTLAFLVPVVAIFLMPGAVAGATLMARARERESEAAGAGAPAPDAPGPGTPGPRQAPAAPGTAPAAGRPAPGE